MHTRLRLRRVLDTALRLGLRFESVSVQLKTEFCGVEKRHLDWLITSKSEVRVLPAATKYSADLQMSGSNDEGYSRPSCYNQCFLIAQLVERLTVNQNVPGSSPGQGAKYSKGAEC